ncbi:MAG: hypothetical protein AB1798_21600, partial [Spirochaetota bacterium]
PVLTVGLSWIFLFSWFDIITFLYSNGSFSLLKSLLYFDIASFFVLVYFCISYGNYLFKKVELMLENKLDKKTTTEKVAEN